MDFDDILADLTRDPREIVVDRATGKVRQAGSDTVEAKWRTEFAETAERDLFFFAKAVLKRTYLTLGLHHPICAWLQRVPPRRKLLLLPREHAKTTIVSHALPLHILLQPAERNTYWPGLDGSDMRVVLACETEARAKDHLRVMKTALETNDLIRGLWPHRIWDAPKQQAKKWSDTEMILPRKNEYPDPSVRAIGVGGAITGAHPTILVKDDLVTLEAANSPAVMEAAIEWHTASRALINEDNCLEFIIGTRWAVHDLYEHIQRNDPTVEIMQRAVIENGKPIYDPAELEPASRGKAFTLAKIEQARRDHGVLFPLLYMNSTADPALTDFNMEWVRSFQFQGDAVEFEETFRDAVLAERLRAPAPETVPTAKRGTPLSQVSYDDVFGRDEWFKHGRVRSA